MRAAFGIEPWEQCVLVFGGSLGSRTINEAALDGLDGASFRVLHVTGVRDWPALRERLAEEVSSIKVGDVDLEGGKIVLQRRMVDVRSAA